MLDISTWSDFIQARVSIDLAGCGTDGAPLLARGLGCLVDSENQQLCIFISRLTAADFIGGVAQNPAVAAVFCRPATEQSVQIKGSVLAIRALTDADRRALENFRLAFAEEIAPLGYSAEFASAYRYDEDALALIIQPLEIYEQTPGPLAGSLLGTIAR